MNARDIMTEKVISCKANQTVSDAARIMLENNIGGLPIVDEQGNLLGIITESDFIGKKVDIPHAMVSLTQLLGETYHYGDIDEIFDKAKTREIEKVMQKKPQTVSPDTSVAEISDIMLKNNLTRLPVVEDGKLIGIATRRDILRAFTKGKIQ